MEGNGSQENDQHYRMLQRGLNAVSDQDTLQAPSTLLASLEMRITRYKSEPVTPVSAEQLQQALHHEHWEARMKAIECLDRRDMARAYAVLALALHDEHRFVRMAALRVLAHNETSMARSLLTHGLLDRDWQVREVAVQVLGMLRDPAVLATITPALHDENAEVREAAQLVLHQYEQLQAIFLQSNSSVQPTIQIVEEENHTMQGNQQFIAISQDHLSAQTDSSQSVNVSHFSSRKKRMRRPQLLMLVATLVLAIGVLTAAGYSWWNYQMGNPSMYATVNQQQTSHGLTITVTKVYADEGHTIIAYDLPIGSQNTHYIVQAWKLTGSFPQKEDALSSSSSITYGNGNISQSDNNVDHRYMTQPQFLVPAGADQLTIHLDITRLGVSHLVNGQSVGKITWLQGNWNFTFTVPFHHNSDTHIPSPIE